jgi:hypothetical protein
MRAIISYIKTQCFMDTSGHYGIGGASSFIINYGAPKISYCHAVCAAEIKEYVKVPFTIFEFCSLETPIRKTGICVWCVNPTGTVDYITGENCLYLPFDSLCAVCHERAQSIRTDLITKKLLLGILLLPELAATIVGLMGQLPARD